MNLSKRNILRTSLNRKNVASRDRSEIRETETVRCSSLYQTEKEMISKEVRDNKLKWMNGKEFKRFFSNKNSKEMVQNLNIQSPYISPSSHKFRVDEKNKWISRKKFL